MPRIRNASLTCPLWKYDGFPRIINAVFSTSAFSNPAFSAPPVDSLVYFCHSNRNRFSEAKASVPGTSNKLSDWLNFLHGLAQQRRPRNERNLAPREPRGEDNARTSNTRIVQWKRAMPHLTIKNMTCGVVTALWNQLWLRTSVTTRHDICLN